MKIVVYLMCVDLDDGLWVSAYATGAEREDKLREIIEQDLSDGNFSDVEYAVRECLNDGRVLDAAEIFYNESDYANYHGWRLGLATQYIEVAS